ncbi:hypothetical protein ACFE04_021946 [Oxalis oulophora]
MEITMTQSSSSSSSSSLKRKRPPMISIPNVLQEIQNDSNNISNNDYYFARQSDAGSFNGVGVAVYAQKGNKKFMEDTHKIASSSNNNNNNNGFYGVYDGHGGNKAAQFVAHNLHNNVFQTINNCKDHEEKIQAVKAAYLKTDHDFLEQFGSLIHLVRKGCNSLPKQMLRPLEGLVSGTCCVTALIDGQELVISHVGDCRAVLCKGGVAEALTKDHRAEREDERKRIENEGGYVEIHRGAWRVHGILTVSRSIGDAHLKKWVLGEPDTMIIQLTRQMDFLILASDGLWEQVSNQDAVDSVKRILASKKLGPTIDVIQDNNENYSHVNVSPSAKLKRISLVKQLKASNQSPRSNKKSIDGLKEDEDDHFGSETGSPPSKSRRISLFKRINVKPETPRPCQENKSACVGLMAACKELVNLAVSRGSLDDITVMIIDLNQIKS